MYNLPEVIDHEAIDRIGIQVLLKRDYPVITETLERMGIINRTEKKIFPSFYCIKTHLKTKEDKEIYTVAHFKELFVLQDKPSTFNDQDEIRLKTGVYLLNDWGLIEVLNPEKIENILVEKIKVLPYKFKSEYQIVHKFKLTQGIVKKDK